MKDNRKVTTTAAVALALTAVIGFAAANAEAKKDVSQKNSEASVITNDNGSVSRSFTECTVTTNGNLVTEHRRETRTTLDTEGNLLESSTSEYAQSYSVGDTAMTPLPAIGSGTAGGKCGGRNGAAAAEKVPDSFLGLKFGEEFKGGTNFVYDADEPTLLRTTFKPKKPLAGFDDFYVYVTPTTHRVAKVYACAKNAVEPGARWKRHYLIEALEKKYQTWARLASYWKPLYAFDIGEGRHLRICLADASDSYETVIVAWDDGVLGTALDETEAAREAARKAAAEKRASRVNDAAAAF